MTPNSFTFLVSGVDPMADDFEDRFFEAGCDDATLALMNGVVAIGFDRVAESYMHAVFSAYRDVLAAGATVERFEPDFLVSKAEIAKRANLTRAAISQYVSGERGRDFPKPVARITSASPLWDWVDVSAWLHRTGQVPLEEVINARISRVVNGYLQGSRTALKTGDGLLLRKMKQSMPKLAAA
ncbi:hypothetical protein CH339_14110 [Rhodobium orientis]|uniref:Uncharacterized protein n=2 Tax=Rhodobium orientis TaxID=34017 RepID=A0A327JNJ7_9HYPH|nr:hypothetical protein [Rhodobium orientis]RAI26462.1 hypothetical protein CH339_14110 [Rhodobium orientis]